MDSVTHTLIGVGMANAFFRRRVGPQAVIILALASNLPDIDGIVHLSGDPTAILLRRTFGHSLFTIPIWSLALAAILKRFYPQFRILTLFGLVILGASVHLFFDLVNSFGVVLLWPFSDWRPELAIVFIIDLFLTCIFILPLFLHLSSLTKPYLEWGSRIAIACCVVYVIFCGVNRIKAQQVLAADIDYRRKIPEFVYVFPEPLGPHRWRGVIREKETYRIYLIYSLSGRIEIKDDVQTWEGDPNVERVRSTPLAHRLEWLFKAPVWSVKKDRQDSESPAESPIEVSVYDLRFRSVIINRQAPFVYRFIVYADGRVDLVKA